MECQHSTKLTAEVRCKDDENSELLVKIESHKQSIQ